MTTRRAKNTTIAPKIRALAEGWCEANDMPFSNLVEDLLREHLREAGLPVDATMEEVMRFAAQYLKDAEKPRAAKKK